MRYGVDSEASQLQASPYQALVYSNGTVIWVPAVNMELDCTEAIEVQKSDCNIKLGSWTYDANHLNLVGYDYDDEGRVVVGLKWYSKVHGLEIEQVGGKINTNKYSCCEEPYMDIDFS